MKIEHLSELFREKPEAWSFLLLHSQLTNIIDDLIDEDFQRERLLRAFYIASLLYSSDYFLRNRAILLPIEHQIINTYADSVDWETSGEEKKVAAADVIRHCGQEMVFAVIKLEFGYDMLRQLSGKLREMFLNT